MLFNIITNMYDDARDNIFWIYTDYKTLSIVSLHHGEEF